MIIVPIALNRHLRVIGPTWTRREVMMDRIRYLHVDRHVVGESDILLRIPEGQRCQSSLLCVLR